MSWFFSRTGASGGAAESFSWASGKTSMTALTKGSSMTAARQVSAASCCCSRRVGAPCSLDTETIQAVKAEVRRRLDGTAADDATGKDSPLEMARRMHADGRLGEAAVGHAVQYGDRAFALAGVAVLADLPLETVSKAISTRSVKGTVAMAWKA